MTETEELHLKQIQGLKKTISNLVEEKGQIQKENHQLRRDLGILDEEGFLEKPSLPLIRIGVGYKGRPECEEHGTMLRYKNDIWRCEACKTSVDLSENLRWIREEFDGVVVIQ